MLAKSGIYKKVLSLQISVNFRNVYNFGNETLQVVMNSTQAVFCGSVAEWLGNRTCDQ